MTETSGERKSTQKEKNKKKKGHKNCHQKIEEMTERSRFSTLICKSIDVHTNMCVYVVHFVKSMLSDT